MLDPWSLRCACHLASPAICTGTHRNLNRYLHQNPPELQHGICTGTLRNLMGYLHQNLPEPQQVFAPEPSRTSPGICTGTLRKLARNLVLKLHRIAPELIWAKDPIAKFCCWGKTENNIRCSWTCEENPRHHFVNSTLKLVKRHDPRGIRVAGEGKTTQELEDAKAEWPLEIMEGKSRCPQLWNCRPWFNKSLSIKCNCANKLLQNKWFVTAIQLQRICSITQSQPLNRKGRSLKTLLGRSLMNRETVYLCANPGGQMSCAVSRSPLSRAEICTRSSRGINLLNLGNASKTN